MISRSLSKSGHQLSVLMQMYALDWQPNDFAIWANRRILHSASPTDEYDGSARLFHLVFLDCKTSLNAAQE